MDYSQLIQAIKNYSYHELLLLKDTLAQKINMVYDTSDDDPENTRADLIDQLNAVIAEISIRVKNGETDIYPKEQESPIITTKAQKFLSRPISIRMTPKKLIIIIIAVMVIYRLMKRR